MSLPNIPDIKPKITVKREQAINLILASIAMEEISLSHILNAEGEKIQSVICHDDHTIHDLLKVNRSVERTLRNVIKTQMLLQFKLEDTLDLICKDDCDSDDDCDKDHDDCEE